MSKSTNAEEGSVLTIVALMMFVFILFLGLAVDGGYTYLQRTRLQQVADAEALACVISPSSRPCPQNGGEALYTELNPYGFDVHIENPGNNSLCLTGGQTGCARATAQVTWDTFLIRVAGFNQLTLSATAVAGRNKVSSCIITTADFRANGTNIVNLNNCAASIGGNLSSTNQSGINISGAGSITVFNGNSPNNCGSCSPLPVGVSSQLPDLPSSAIPTKNINGTALTTLPYTSCTNSSCIPAIYTGGVVTLNANTTLQTGYYVFNNGFNNNGKTLTSGAGGVGLYIPGNMPLSLSGTVNLSAPAAAGCTSGSGVVVSHPYSTKYNNITLNGSGNDIHLTGVVNFSADDITVDGSPVALYVEGSLVTHSIRLNGNMYPGVSSNPCYNLYESSGNVMLVD